MAVRSLTLPFIFAFLLLSQVFALDLEKKPDNRDENVPGAGDAKFPYGPGPYIGHRPPHCRYYCDTRCCSAEEFAAFSKPANQVGAGSFNDQKTCVCYSYPIVYPPIRCVYRCGYRCCSAKEYAEFVQAGN